MYWFRRSNVHTVFSLQSSYDDSLRWINLLYTCTMHYYEVTEQVFYHRSAICCCTVQKIVNKKIKNKLNVKIEI